MFFSFSTFAAAGNVAPNKCAALFSAGHGPTGKLTSLSRRSEGSTGGRWIQDEAGNQWFVKKDVHYSELQTSAEVISSKIYQFFGYRTPETVIIVTDGVRYSASRDIGENNTWTDFSNMNSTEIRQMRIVASYLKDWDRLGNPSNNRLSPDGALTILDFGGTLGARAQGRHKPGRIFSNAIGNFEATPDVSVIYDSFQVQAESNHPWNRLIRRDAELIVNKFRQLDDAAIETIVDSAQYSNQLDRDYMVQALKIRRDGIIQDMLSRFP